MIRVDDRDLVRTVAALKRAGDREVVNGLRRGMTAAGRRVRDRVKDEARAKTRSRRIPRSIKSSVRMTAKTVRITIKADAAVAPHARVMEGQRDGSPARHPVFAKGARSGWTWTEQNPRPYFYDTARGEQPEAERDVYRATEEAVRRAVGGRA